MWMNFLTTGHPKVTYGYRMNMELNKKEAKIFLGLCVKVMRETMERAVRECPDGCLAVMWEERCENIRRKV